MVFPNPEAGFIVDETGTPAAPSFGRKKDAKQYAAKCCAEWLMKAGYMPSDGVNVEFPKTKKARPQPLTPPTTAAPLLSAQTPPANRATTTAATPAATEPATTTNPLLSAQIAPANRATTTATTTAATTTQQQDETAAQRVTSLCRLRTFNTSLFISPLSAISRATSLPNPSLHPPN